MTKEKPDIPPSHVLLEDAAKSLKDAGYEITYNGLYYYRRLGILPAPERIPGSKFKYYNINDLIEVMFIVDFLRGVFHLNMEKIAFLVKSVGLDKVKFLMYKYFEVIQIATWARRDEAKKKEGYEENAFNKKDAIGMIRSGSDLFGAGMDRITNMDGKTLEKYSDNDLAKEIFSDATVQKSAEKLAKLAQELHSIKEKNQ